MKGSLILEKVNDRQLRNEWQGYLSELEAALENLGRAIDSPVWGSSRMQYLEAVLRFAEARDNERNFFWDTFVEPRVPDVSVSPRAGRPVK